MKTSWMVLVVLSSALAWGQRPPDANDGCIAVNGFGPYRCPNGSGCGQYYTYSGADCNVENEASCAVMQSVSYCCAKYPINTPIEPCLITEMKNPFTRDRILELAEDNDILVPTCSGAYLSAKMAFENHKERGDGGGV
ncbi:MAG: hypothetical protein WAL56_03135 [Candidatus Sulfotelmatobacter sp.]